MAFRLTRIKCGGIEMPPRRALRFIDLTGKRFGNLTPAWPVGRRGKGVVWLCFCKCGRTTLAKTGSLRYGEHYGCGCALGERHGAYKTLEYKIFNSAKQRCRNEKNPKWKYYGGRGIKFLFTSFRQFMKELGPRPPGLTVDRINNDGNYEPGNVRWATRSEQQLNRRKKCAS